MNELILIMLLQIIAAVFGFESFKKDDENFTCYNNGICLPEGYDKLEVPSKHMTIEITIKIVQVTEVHDEEATVDILAWISFQWEDSRIMFQNGTQNGDGSFLDGLLNEKWSDRLWFPSIYYYRLKSYQYQNKGLYNGKKVLRPESFTFFSSYCMLQGYG